MISKYGILATIGGKNVSETNNNGPISINLRNAFHDRFPPSPRPIMHLSPLICIFVSRYPAIICKWAVMRRAYGIQNNNFHRIVHEWIDEKAGPSTDSYSPPCFPELNKFRWKIGFAIFINFYSAYFFPSPQFFSTASHRWPRRAEISNIFSILSSILVFAMATRGPLC